MDLETSQRSYLFAGGGKPVALGEIVRRMVQVRARYNETVNDGERTLLRGEYKYFSGKLCELRAAQTADLVAYLECAAFFGFWDVGQVDRILEVLHQRSMSLWLNASSSSPHHPTSTPENGRPSPAVSTRLPSADEIDVEELRRLLLCLPMLRKEGSTMYRHACHLFTATLTSEEGPMKELLSPEDAAALLLASTSQTPTALLLVLLEILAPAVKACSIPLSTMVELLDTLGALTLSALSCSSSTSPAIENKTPEEREEEDGILHFLPLWTLLMKQLYASRGQLDPLEVAMTYYAIVRFQEAVQEVKATAAGLAGLPEESAGDLHPPPPPAHRHPHQEEEEKLHRNRRRCQRMMGEVEKCGIPQQLSIAAHHAFLDTFIAVGSQHLCPRAAGIFFSAFAIVVGAERRAMRCQKWNARQVEPLHHYHSTSSLTASGATTGPHRSHEEDPHGEDLHPKSTFYPARRQEEEDTALVWSSLIPRLSELLGPRVVYLAIEFTPAELIPILQVWMYGLVHHFSVKVGEWNRPSSPSSSSPPLPCMERHCGTFHSPGRSSSSRTLSPWSPCFSTPPAPLIHVIAQLLEQLTLVLGEASSFVTSSELISLFHLFQDEVLMEMKEQAMTLVNEPGEKKESDGQAVLSTGVAHPPAEGKGNVNSLAGKEEGPRRSQREDITPSPLFYSRSTSTRVEKTTTLRPRMALVDGRGGDAAEDGARLNPTETAKTRMTSVPFPVPVVSPSMELGTRVLLRWLPSLERVWKLLSDKVPAMCLSSSATPLQQQELEYLLQVCPCLLRAPSRNAVRQAWKTRLASSFSSSFDVSS